MDKVIKDVAWRARNSKSDPWIRYAYCDGSLTCIVEKPMLPNGVKVMNVSKGTLTLRPSAKTTTVGITELRCLVHYSDSTTNSPRVVKIHYSNLTVCKFSCPACFLHMYILLVDRFDKNFRQTHRLQEEKK